MSWRPARWRRSHQIEALESRRLLSTVTWNSATGGAWNTAGDWSTGVVPQPGDDVVINQPGNIRITESGGTSVNSIALTGDTLEVSSGTLAVTGAVTNSGAIIVDGAAQMTVGGNYMGSTGSTLSLPGGGPTTDPTSNLLTNSGFETPVVSTSGTTAPSNWPDWGSSYLSNQFAYSGAQSLQTSGPNSGVLQSFPVTPTASYTLSAYAMTPASAPLTGSEAGFMQLIFYDSGGNQISPYAPPNAITVLGSSSAPGGPLTGAVGNQGWNHFSMTVAAPANAATVNAVVEAGAFGAPGTGSVYWDAPKFGPAALGPSKFTAGNISNSGAIIVGPTNSVTSGGTFAQTSSGSLDIQLGGAPSTGDFGSVTSAGAASFAGTLKSDLVYGYVPSTTDTFVPIQYPSESGSFSSQQLPSGTGYQINAAVTFTNVTLSGVPTTPLTATVNAATALHPVTTNLLGVNLAWWDGSLTTTQTQQLAEAAGLTVYRFPGGSSSDDYHFNVSSNYGDGSAVTIPQFAQFIQNVGGTGLITLDYGSGSPQEAAAELAYLQGSPSDTTSIGTGIEWNDSTNAWQNVNWQTVGYWASLRAAAPLGTDDGLNFLRIDHPTAFANIKYWEVGNEEYGGWEIDHHGTAAPGGVSTGAQHDPATYVTFAEQFSAYASEIVTTAGLPALSIGIDSGDPTGGSDNNWTRNVLTAGSSIGFVPNFISDHSYMQAPGSENDQFLLNDTVTNPFSIDDWSVRYSDYQTMLQQTVGSHASSVQVMATEFNSVYTNPGKQSTSLVNGLFVAESIGSLLDSGYVGGFVWDLRNGFDSSSDQNSSDSLYGWRLGGDYGILGSPGNSAPTSGAYIAYPNYFAEQLASDLVQLGGQVVAASDNYSELNVYAVLESNGHLRLMVINSNPAAALSEQFNLQGFQPSGQAQFWQYGVAQDAAQSQSSTGAAALSTFGATLSLSGANFSYSFPAYSMTVIDLAPQPGVINGTGTTSPVALTRDADHQHIDWTFGAVSGQVLISAAAGLTINGNDTINPNYANGNPLPAALHLNGTFTINNLASAQAGTNPLAGTNLEIGRGTVYISYAAGHDLLAAIQTYLKNGYNAGAWTGAPTVTTGVITSTAAAGDVNKSSAIGYVDSADGLITDQPVNIIELKYTLYGDTGLTGTVGFTDFMRMTQHYTSTAGTWDTGDFNYDGTVDANDFNLLKPNYGQTLPAPAPAPIASTASGRPPRVATLLPPAPLTPVNSSSAASLMSAAISVAPTSQALTIARSRKRHQR